MKKMPFYIILLILKVVLLYSCSSWIKMGNFTIISTRNLEAKSDYRELRRYVEGYDNGKTITNTGESIKTEYNGKLSAAVEDAVRSVPGGEFIKNAEVYYNNGKYKIRGDVWGLIENSTKNQYGYNINIGDKIFYKSFGTNYKGVVIAIDATEATIKYYEGNREKIKKVEYDNLIKQELNNLEYFLQGDVVMWKKPQVSGGCLAPSKPQKEEYLKGVIIALKGEYAVIKCKNDTGEEKIIEILQSNLIKLM